MAVPPSIMVPFVMMVLLVVRRLVVVSVWWLSLRARTDGVGSVEVRTRFAGIGFVGVCVVVFGFDLWFGEWLE